jgi:hemolysin-activating ACP:hemolysin acyltransferase
MQLRRHLDAEQQATIGGMIDLCARYTINHRWTIRDIERLFVPPVLHKQCRLLKRGEEIVGFATWAYLSNSWHRRLLYAHKDPDQNAWRSGNTLWVIDIVMPTEGVRSFTRQLQKDIFLPDEKAGYALRRDESGRVKRVCRLYAHTNSKLSSGGQESAD